MNEHGVSRTSIQTWEKQYDNSGKFTVKDNLSESEKELRLLRKENILKQAALILGLKYE